MPVLYFLKPLAQWFVLKGYLAEGIKPSPIDDHGVQIEQWSVYLIFCIPLVLNFPVDSMQDKSSFRNSAIDRVPNP